MRTFLKMIKRSSGDKGLETVGFESAGLVLSSLSFAFLGCRLNIAVVEEVDATVSDAILC